MVSRGGWWWMEVVDGIFRKGLMFWGVVVLVNCVDVC